jgi:hypothetical protein
MNISSEGINETADSIQCWEIQGVYTTRVVLRFIEFIA